MDTLMDGTGEILSLWKSKEAKIVSYYPKKMHVESLLMTQSSGPCEDPFPLHYQQDKPVSACG